MLGGNYKVLSIHLCEHRHASQDPSILFSSLPKDSHGHVCYNPSLMSQSKV